MSKNLRQFLKAVKKHGPSFYVEVERPLKPVLEPCVIQEKLAKEGLFPVIYCSDIEGSSLPLVTNLFGSYEMLGLALELSPEEGDKAKILREFMRRIENARSPRVVPASTAPVKQIILKGKDVDLGLLPIIHHAELNSGKYIPIGCMVCKNPDTGVLNVGVYRHELKGKDQLGCMIAPPHHAAYNARRYAELSKPMEVAIFIGHHPAVILGSQTKVGLDASEFESMGGLLEEPLEVTQAETVDLLVPTQAEIVIEGVIDPRNMVTDGPFSEYPGYYGESNKPCYLIKLTAITMRKDAIYHDLDPAHQEHNLTEALASEAAVYDLVKRAVPTVIAVHQPPSGTCVYHIYVSIKKRVQGEGKFAGLTALTADPMSKMVVVVDEDIDIYNEKEVLWAIATRVQGDKDITIIPYVLGAHLDPSAYDETRLKRGTLTTKVIIDATRPVDLPFATRITPPKELWESINLKDYLKRVTY